MIHDIALFNRVRDAARVLEGHAHRTPVFTSRTLRAAIGAEVFFKCENLQRMGAFKFRGAYYAVSRLTDEERRKGIVTFSSGNHAQAVALVGRSFGIPVTVVMPDDAPSTKKAATLGYGATIVGYDPARDSRENIARQLQEKTGMTLVPPFDHPDVIVGQGTAALELIEDIGPLDAVLAPCGGGGLLSGTALAVKGLCPSCRVIGVEPEGADDATTSFRTGTLHTVTHPKTIADGVRTPSLGKHTFPLILRHVSDMVTVSEEAIAEAVRWLFYRMKLVVEPSGALGLAALLSRSFSAGGRIGVILSGGNIDGPTMTTILSENSTHA
ncbi:MAG: threo-3-hydroxy-L-aspartate ammonia-lyase [Thermodesulfobacteriota bacterium]